MTMDNVKMPFLPEETLRTQRVEIYLTDLKKRLKDLRIQHDEVIQNSVDIIKEIDQVSSTLLLPQTAENSEDARPTNIKKLIRGFEAAKEPCLSRSQSVQITHRVDIQKILRNFEKLNETHVLKESLALFKRAKESFDKIDTIFDKFETKTPTPMANISFATTTLESEVPPPTPVTQTLHTTVAPTSPNTTICNENVGLPAIASLKNKINMFNTISESTRDGAVSHYASCCSSVMSIDTFRSAEEIDLQAANKLINTNSFENGYEGDNDDSEYDLFAIKKKKSKPNN